MGINCVTSHEALGCMTGEKEAEEERRMMMSNESINPVAFTCICMHGYTIIEIVTISFLSCID